MKQLLLIFPNQLFRPHPGLALNPDRVLVIEDNLFFGDPHHPMQFHKQKLWLHRASMKRFVAGLGLPADEVQYADYAGTPNALADTLLPWRARCEGLLCVDPVDYLLRRRLLRIAARQNWQLEFLPNPNFYNTTADNIAYRAQKKRWFMADFYKCQRQRFNILMDGESPVGGQWSFDAHNRSKIAKQDLNKIPTLQFPAADDFDREAQDYVKRKFPDHPGEIDTLFYPTSHEAAQQWLDQFLNERLPLFGPYEDAMEQNQSWLWHGVLTPMLNIGLLNPRDVIAQAVEVAPTNGTPLNSLEGFVRQILGWREFMRATYEELGVTMRTTNFWNHHRPIPRSFYDGTTGIPPLDDTLLRLRKTGYCHHIERLMVLGGFMFLCEFDPDEIYKWFMEMFVDSYDWVMVPNVYAMSQNADGGLITTKPYFSGSAYIRKMSHYPAGDWCNVWDGLYWRWIHLHSEALGQNPRWAMMVSMCKKMPPEKRNGHLTTAESFLKSLAK